MSAQVCLLIIVIVVSMAILFRKIVRTDARDDFKIKNILRYNDEERVNEYVNNEPEKETVYNNYEYKTEAHLNNNSDDLPPQKEIYSEVNDYKEKNDNKADEGFNGAYEIYENPKNIQNKKIKKDIIQMIKSFYRGITFTIGLLVCLYSLFGIIKFVQTTDDAIIYSIWLLIGVILIK